jgi:hypothetical protein
VAGKPEGRILLDRQRHRWQDNIKMDAKETGWDIVDCIHLAEYRDKWRAVWKNVMNLRVP